MSTTSRDDDAAEVEVSPLPSRRDGASALSPRVVVQIMIDDPAVRNYAIAALAGLALVVMALLEQGSDIGALLIAVVGAGGVLLRWRAAAVGVIILLTYFQFFPFGSPLSPTFSYRGRIADHRFEFMDVLLVFAVVVYVIAQFRLLALLARAMPAVGATPNKNEPVIRRPPALIRAGEVRTMLLAAFGLVIVGQLTWFLVTSLEVAPVKPLPLAWTDARPAFSEPPRFLPPWASRFYVIIGMLFAGTMLARLVFGYWRLRTLGREEASMFLLDQGWRETSRERQRQEKWRAWGRARAEARSKRKR